MRRSASGMPTSVSMAIARRAASSSDTASCARITSVSCMPIVNTGFSDVIGSWKIMLIERPRTLRISSHGSASRFWPFSVISPATMRPGGLGMSRSTLSAVTLLPEPDSPTSPSTSPARTSRSMPSTALATPASVSK